MSALGPGVLRVFAWLVVGYLLLPLVVIAGASVSETAFLKFPPDGFTLKWYRQFLTDTSYLDAIGLSTHLALAATVGALALGVPVALALSRRRGRWFDAIGALFLSPLILPQIVIGAAILQFMAGTGLARTYVALLVGHVVLVVPYVIRTTLASLALYPASLEDAARDLGDSGPGTFVRITLPLIRPGLIAGSLFSFITSWINVELSIFNTTAQLMVIPVKIFNYVQYNVDPVIAAVSSATIIVAVLAVVVIDIAIGLDRAAGVAGTQ